LTTPLSSTIIQSIPGEGWKILANYEKPLASIALGATSATSTTNLNENMFFIRCNATAGAFNINLPAAAGVPGRLYSVMKTDATGASVTINPNALEQINGASLLGLTGQYHSVIIQSDGIGWYVLSGYKP
jgi:hypothetical protein